MTSSMPSSSVARPAALPNVDSFTEQAQLQQLLENQTRELREAQKLENARALGQVQLEVRKSIGELCDDLRTVNVQLAGFSVRMDDFERKQAELEEQLKNDQVASTRAPSMATSSGLVMGGWVPGLGTPPAFVVGLFWWRGSFELVRTRNGPGPDF